MYFGSFWSILYCLFEVLFDFSVDNSHIVLQCFREYHSVFLMIVLSNIWKYAPPPFPVNMPPPPSLFIFYFQIAPMKLSTFLKFLIDKIGCFYTRNDPKSQYFLKLCIRTE